MLTRFPKIWSKVDELLQRPDGGNNNPFGCKGKPEGITVDNVNSDSVTRPTGNSKAATIRRLKKDAPELAEKVLNEEMTANAAAILAGFQKKTVTVPVDVEAYLSTEAKERQREALERGNVTKHRDTSIPQIIAEPTKNRDNESAVKAAKIVGPLKVINIQNICRFCLTEYDFHAITL